MPSKTKPRLLVWDEGLNRGGIDRVTCSLLPELAKHAERVDWLAPTYRHDDFSDAANQADNLYLHNLHGIWNSKRDEAWNSVLRRMRKFTIGRPKLRRITAQIESSQRLRSAAKILQSTHLYLPAILDHTFPSVRLPVFATLHDLNFREEWRGDCLKSVHDWSIHAQGIICISKTVHRDVEEAFPECKSLITTVPNAVSSPYLQPKRQAKSDGEPIRIYYPASFYSHKQHYLLIEAVLEAIRKGFSIKVELSGVNTELTCSQAPLHEEYLERARIAASKANQLVPETIIGHGYITESAVENLYATADLVALPTKSEGFGLPLREALDRGVPVICSNIEAFREQLNGNDFSVAVTLVENNSDWANKLVEAIQTSQDRTLKLEKVISTCPKQWTWEQAAAAYYRIFTGKCD